MWAKRAELREPTTVRPPAEPMPRANLLLPKKSGCTRFQDLADSSRVAFVYSGRYAIYHALRALNETARRTILVPAFQCPTVVDPVLHAGLKIRFYGIGTNLTVQRHDFLSKLTPDVGAAVFIRYFGFPSGVDELLPICRAYGVLSIDDWSHSFLAAAPTRLATSCADAVIYSFKKLLPTLTGGGILAHFVPLQESRLSWPPFLSSLTRVKQLVANALSKSPPAPELSDLTAPDVQRRLQSSMPAIRLSASAAYPYRPEYSWTKMPISSRIVLQRTCLNMVVEARRRNYLLLDANLRNGGFLTRVQDHLPTDTCPWGFPVLLANRSAHDHRLRTLGIPLFTFGEVLHPLLFEQVADGSEMVEIARFLADSLLAFAIHQDLDEQRVRRYANLIDTYLRHEGLSWKC